MFNKIVHTLGSRLIIAVFNLLLLVISTKLMGAEVKGEISLYVLNLSLAVIIGGIVGGPALVYLAPRHSLSNILLINLIWGSISTGILTIGLDEWGLLHSISGWRFFRMAIIENIIAICLMLMLGKEKIKHHNFAQIAKVVVAVSCLFLFINIFDATFIRFVDAYEISLIITSFICMFTVVKLVVKDQIRSSIASTMRMSMQLGTTVQIGSIAQLFNYRLSYYILELLISPPSIALIRIGIYSAAVQLSEALWQFTRSVNAVQYSSVSNMENRKEGLSVSLALARLNYSVTAIGVLTLLLLPIDFYDMIFGSEFHDVKHHFTLLSPGIIAIAIGGSIGHFFAGVGDHKYNTIASLVGLGLTIPLSFYFIQNYNTEGAAIATTIVYCVQVSVQYWFLAKKDDVRFSSLLLRRSDLTGLLSQISNIWNRR